MSDKNVYSHTSGILKGIMLDKNEMTVCTVVGMNVRFNLFFQFLTNDDFPLPSSSYLKMMLGGHVSIDLLFHYVYLLNNKPKPGIPENTTVTNLTLKLLTTTDQTLCLLQLLFVHSCLLPKIIQSNRENVRATTHFRTLQYSDHLQDYSISSKM